MAVLGLFTIMLASVILSLVTYLVKKADIDCNSDTFCDALFATGKYRNMVPGTFWILLIIITIIISIVAW